MRLMIYATITILLFWKFIIINLTDWDPGLQRANVSRYRDHVFVAFRNCTNTLVSLSTLLLMRWTRDFLYHLPFFSATDAGLI